MRRTFEVRHLFPSLTDKRKCAILVALGGAITMSVIVSKGITALTKNTEGVFLPWCFLFFRGWFPMRGGLLELS